MAKKILLFGILIFVLFILGCAFEEVSEEQRVENWIEQNLEEEGYEVIDVIIFNHLLSESEIELNNLTEYTCDFSKDKFCNVPTVSVEVKSLGRRHDQLIDTLITMHSSYTVTYDAEAFSYDVWILEPTQTCTYFIYGEHIAKYGLGSRELNVIIDEDEYCE